MAVSFDAAGSSTGFSTATPSTTPWLTWTHTAGTGGGTVLVALAWGSTSFPPTVSSITYGGNAMTQLAAQASDNSTGNGGILLYGITGQASGANTVLVKTSANPSNVIIGNSMSFTGASAFGTPVANFGLSASATVTVAGTTSGNMVAGAECHGTNGTNTWTSGTRQFDDEVSAATGASNLSGGTIAAGGSVTLTATIASDDWGIIAVEVLSAAAGGIPAAYIGGSVYRRKRQVSRQQLPLPSLPPVVSVATPQPIVIAVPNLPQWFNVSSPIVSFAPQQPTVAPGATTPQPIVVTPSALSQWFGFNQPIVSFAPQQPTAPSVATPEPVIVSAPSDPRWFSPLQVWQSRSSFQDVPAATQPIVSSPSPALQWFVPLQALQGRSSFQDVPPAVQPKISALQPAPIWFVPGQVLTFRNTLQDPPQLTTPNPVVIAAPPASIWFKVGAPQVIVPILQPPPPTFGPTTIPVIVAAPSAPIWFNTQAPQGFRNTLQDPPQLTTPVPEVITPQPDSRWFQTKSQVLTAPIPVVQPTEPIVQAASTPQAFLIVGKPLIVRPLPTVVPPGQAASLPVVISDQGTRFFRPTQPLIIRPIPVPDLLRHPICFGGAVVDDLVLNGTITRQSWDGTIVNSFNFGGTVTNDSLFGGTIVDNLVLAGTITKQDLGFGGTVVGWCMLEVDITAGEFNNESYDFTITSGGNPYDITSKTINMFLKTAAGDSDTAGSTVKLSTATGEIVITNGPGGAATVAWPLLSTTTTPGFYRIEVIVSGKAHTALYGKIGITPL